MASAALQTFGAAGYPRNLPLERMARDARMFTIGGGTAQILRTLVASRSLGRKPPQTRDDYLKSAEGSRKGGKRRGRTAGLLPSGERFVISPNN